jgi:hypothetical protein
VTSSVADIWLRNPFTKSFKQISGINLAKDSHLDLHNDLKLNFDLESMRLGRFWCKLGEAYPILTKLASQVLVPFGTAFLCEFGLSVLFPIKTKVRSKLEAGHDVCLTLLKMLCRTEILVASKQWECLH